MSEKKMRPNVLWLMSDQHNAGCTGYAGHPDVKTPNLDSIAGSGVNFINGFCNNPICAPSRICFATGTYMHTSRMFGNDCQEYGKDARTIAMLFRQYGYQNALIGKSHMVRKWDEAGFERIRYTDLCDALYNDPMTTHYFRYLCDHRLGDLYEEGTPRAEMDYTNDGSKPAKLPYEHSIEHFTGNESLAFLQERDTRRPFFLKMSFQRPHAPIAPAGEYFNLYDPDRLCLPASMADWYENGFAGKPDFMRQLLEKQIPYPFCVKDEKRLRRVLASYYALITCIDMEIGRVIDYLKKTGQYENTIILYTADHGDFAGEHGLFHKNFGIYESIHRIPFLLKYPGSPAGKKIEGLAEAVDYFPTLCALCEIPVPEQAEGSSLLPLISGTGSGKNAVFCEWEWPTAGGKCSAVRTRDYRLVFYGKGKGGELYDRSKDPGEMCNLWNNPEYTARKLELLEMLFSFSLEYSVRTGIKTDENNNYQYRMSPSRQLHKMKKYWSDLEKAYTQERK
ncbi:MAG: hypothetical protein A2096_01430 [Spirochaetes bacterium GWF1_41_5]|nr:MAG: hypothetical protein A2096_01430 [Spirochaetes bacterium GWF1_41_5]HBE03508.1 hypothetical protein [Spirochaetia bacterium]